MDLKVTVCKVKGHCPIYRLGDGFLLRDGYRLELHGPACMHALASLLPYYNALRFATPEQLGIAGTADRDRAYVQCLDPCEYTGGGTVVFEISRQPESSNRPTA